MPVESCTVLQDLDELKRTKYTTTATTAIEKSNPIQFVQQNPDSRTHTKKCTTSAAAAGAGCTVQQRHHHPRDSHQLPQSVTQEMHLHARSCTSTVLYISLVRPCCLKINITARYLYFITDGRADFCGGIQLLITVPYLYKYELIITITVSSNPYSFVICNPYILTHYRKNENLAYWYQNLISNPYSYEYEYNQEGTINHARCACLHETRAGSLNSETYLPGFS